MPKTILIVEDNELNMKLFDELLKTGGYETIQSIDGSDVIEIARERSPDLILMDIQLPERSGLELTKLLKADVGLAHIPIVAVTSFAMLGDEQKILEAGCDDYVSKPISVPTFMKTLANYLS